jgi:hypothetical protein
MLDVASGQVDGTQVGTPGEDAFLEEAIVQLKTDTRGEITQIQSAGDPCPAKPQPTWVGVGHEPSTQDVPDDCRRAGPGVTPRSHRGLVNHLVISGQVERITAADTIDQLLLH